MKAGYQMAGPSMLQNLKNLSKQLPYPIFLRLFYAWYAANDLRRLNRLRRELEIPPLEKADLAAYKRSETVCILGSGRSINAIRAERWSSIARFDTIGFNFWLFHPFVPRMYFFEIMGGDSTPEQHQAFFDIARRRAEEYRESLKVVTNLRRGFACPQEWRGNLYTFEPIPVPSRTVAEFRNGVGYLKRKGMFAQHNRITRLFKQASTLTSLIAFAIALGYRRILLCGIDLSHSEYFFQDAALYPEAHWAAVEPRSEPHPTNRALPWRVPARDVVLALKELVLDPLGIEIFVENRSSALWPGVFEAADSFY